MIRAACLLCIAVTMPLRAQERSGADSTDLIARAVALYNTAATARVTGACDIAASRTIDGDLVVLNGPLTIAGHIRGTVVAINADVRLARGAMVDHDLIVIGGTIAGRDSATIGGSIRLQEEVLRYHLDGDRLVAEHEPAYDDSWWKRYRVHHELRRGEAYTDFFYVASRAYNRVEGLAFSAGPRLQRLTPWGEVGIEALGIIRTASPVHWGRETLGHDLGAHVQFGKPIGVSVGGRAFDVVEPTENWQLTNGEVGLASFVLHQDFRDYYARHGGEAFLQMLNGPGNDLTITFSDERWGTRDVRAPISLWRGGDPWRPNPVMDVGNIHRLAAHVHLDTRSRETAPQAGWSTQLELESGVGELSRISTLGNSLALVAPEHVSYTSGSFDIRRYNRITPNAYLNLRLVAAGWLGGDALPAERRVSVGGPGTLPAYAFRQNDITPDVLQCATGVTLPGTPARCDRVVLAQAELRLPFLWGVIPEGGPDDWWRPRFDHRAQWIVFTDAGRGWNVGTPDGALTYTASRIPPFDTFKTDLGLGVDFGTLGFYGVKSLSDGKAPGRFFVRLGHRF